MAVSSLDESFRLRGSSGLSQSLYTVGLEHYCKGLRGLLDDKNLPGIQIIVSGVLSVSLLILQGVDREDSIPVALINRIDR
jgi:hypothetical protein